MHSWASYFNLYVPVSLSDKLLEIMFLGRGGETLKVSREKQQNTYKGMTIQMAAHFSSETTEIR